MNFEPTVPQLSTSTSFVQPSSQVSSLQTSMLPVQQFSPQRSLLASPAMLYSSYPSSTLQPYYSNPSSAQNFAHISTHTPSTPLLFSPRLLPSASQSRVPTIRSTPSPLSVNQLDMNIEPPSSPFVHYTSPLLSPLILLLPFQSSIFNNHDSHHTSPQSAWSAPTPHDSVLFSSHSQPISPTANHFSPACHNPLFLNSPTTTGLDNIPIANFHFLLKTVVHNKIFPLNFLLKTVVFHSLLTKTVILLHNQKHF